MQKPNDKWTFEQKNEAVAFVTINGRRYESDYSKKIIELIVRRKGVARLPLYLNYRKTRGAKVTGLLDRIAQEKSEIKVLEPGCSAGHISEVLLSHPSVKALVSFDVDREMIEVCREKKKHFHFDNWEIADAALPDFTKGKFDLVILSAMLEHVDPNLRKALIDACYERLAEGGLLVVMESQNRWWPFEYHVIRLPIPYLHYLPPRCIHGICIFLKRYPPSWSFEEFNNPNTGWWGATLAEIRPGDEKTRDVSKDYGLGEEFYLKKWRIQGPKGKIKAGIFNLLSGIFDVFGIDARSFLPAHYAAFRKE